MIFILFLLGCESIVLRKEKPLPFKVKSGVYSFDVFKISYPISIKERERFFKVLDYQLSSLLLQNKRIILLLNEQFIKDSISLSKNGLLEEEDFFSLPASELNESQLKRLLSFFNITGKLKDQEILNLQVKYIFQIVGKEYIERDYTELFKERAIEDLCKQRRRVLALLKFKNFELICEASAYNKREINSIKGYFTKGISLRKNTFNKNLEEYGKLSKVLISDMKESDLKKILSEEDKIDLKEVFILNNHLKGFQLTKTSIIFLINGEEGLNNYGYDFIFIFHEVELENISEHKSDNLISDIYKTDKELTEELAKQIKASKKLEKEKSKSDDKR